MLAQHSEVIHFPGILHSLLWKLIYADTVTDWQSAPCTSNR